MDIATEYLDRLLRAIQDLKETLSSLPEPVRTKMTAALAEMERIAEQYKKP